MTPHPLTNKELFDTVASIYRDYPLIIELVERARKLDFNLWVATVSDNIKDINH